MSSSDIKDELSSDLPTSSKRKAEWFDIDDDRNCHVYVSGLPTNMTEDEFIDLMKKYGIIAKKPIPGNPFNVKLYTNKETGEFKGDARCCFARVESVELAINYLDGYQYDEKHILHCEKAKFQIKGSYDPTKKPRMLDKKAKIKEMKKIDKLLSWEPKKTPDLKQKKVILKNMFSPEEILEDATVLLVLREDIEAKCEELLNCEPKRIDIFDKHPEGVIEVTFAEVEQAEKFIKSLDGEFYAGKVVKAEFWDGKTKYRIKETDEEAEKRLEKWHEDINKD